ncbi:restriction endonuclease subunit S [Acinetobacter sp. YH12236]|uniref:restriction endonuclease subunit S n=1 Tax=Acinetobacter sp. YH12236 TaxID=2601163 RepID=UPI0015D410EB
MSYPLVSIAEVATINPRPPKDISLDTLVSFVPMASVSEEGFLLNEEIRDYEEVKKGFTYFSKEDVLIAKITPCFENGKSLRPFQINNDIAFGSTEFHVLRANPEKLSPKYLFYLLWSDYFRLVGEHAMSGAAGQKRVSTDFLKSFKIPLPPLEEQCRIASILDKADDLRQKRQQAIEKLDQLLQSTFIDMFGDPICNQKGWDLVSAKKVLKIQGGYAFPSSDFSTIGIPVVKIGNANKLGFNTEKFDFIIPQQPEKLTQYELRSGDLLMSLTGTVGKDDYGNITEVTDDYEMYYLNQRVAKIEVTNNLFSKNYIRYFFSQHSIKSLITKNNRGVRQANISNSDIYELLIPLPAKEVLLKFDLFIKSTNELKLYFKIQLGTANKLFKSLQNQAFSGTL